MSTKLRTLAKVPQPVPQLAPHRLVALRDTQTHSFTALEAAQTGVLKHTRIGQRAPAELVQQRLAQVAMVHKLCQHRTRVAESTARTRLDRQRRMCRRDT